MASCKKCRTILTEMADSKAGAGNIQDEPGASFVPGNKYSKGTNTDVV